MLLLPMIQVPEILGDGYLRVKKLENVFKIVERKMFKGVSVTSMPEQMSIFCHVSGLIVLVLGALRSSDASSHCTSNDIVV